MAHISNQERIGLEELFVSIEKGRYSRSGKEIYRRTLSLLKGLSKLYPSAILRLWHR